MIRKIFDTQDGDERFLPLQKRIKTFTELSFRILNSNSSGIDKTFRRGKGKEEKKGGEREKDFHLMRGSVEEHRGASARLSLINSNFLHSSLTFCRYLRNKNMC
jgi:hypothetical protein